MNLKLTKRWLLQIGISLTQFANACIPPVDGTLSWADESLSSRAHRARADGRSLGWTAGAIDWLFGTLFRQQNHCQKAFDAEALRRATAPQERA